ncbi:MAG: peptide/nickel transport system substrate-binding protein [Solirubrobacteraceae bacterium]|jgi:peptide/nickel transport system substrate-binding protein|nr:peptide/nickel transport system substrate-binding protein [Gaiellales bacterium]MEA2197742.1 peptide/nickel transport system substrate-binding protein [Solirubrobacteraceae bacterium]
MARDTSRLDTIRADRSELENHYIDELVSGSISRRQFVRRGAVIGMSASVLSAVLTACGGANNTSSTPASTGTTAGQPTKGGTLKLALQTPAGAINPLTISDAGGLCMLAQTGEFLAFDNNMALQLQPMLATSWKPNADGSMWTFSLRPGVKFHNGAALTADDVVYTFQQLADPKNTSNALSTFTGVLKPSGVVKVDASTVAFHLEAPNGNFPYLVSSDNYNAIIVPKGTDFAKWQSTFMGTGPFKLRSYSQNAGANFVANPDYWGGAPNLASTAFTFYASQQPQILALQGGQVDVIVQFVTQGAQSLLNNSSYNIIKLKSANHRELSMRNDMAPFTDPRVRQAIALALDRPGMVAALLSGDGVLGNDSPFSPKFPSTNTSAPQRAQDIAKAKQLLAAAGHPNGFSTTLTTEQYEEVPALAQVIAQAASKIGVTMKLKVETQTNYYGKSTYGNSDWLDAIVSLVDYGDRGVPNVFLEAPLTSGGPWNAAHFKNPTYDGLVKQYVASVDLQTQRTLAGKIETLLLNETPLVIPYFVDGLTATTANVHGVNPTSISAIYLKDAYKA